MAVAPLLIHHPKHLEAVQAGIDFMFYAFYQSHSDRIISYLEKSILKFNKLKWAFDEQRLGSNGQKTEHFNIPKLHALTHYGDWIREMGALHNVNIALTEALHKTVKAAFCHSNKVDFVPQMCFWDDWWLSVEMREATLCYLAMEYIGYWSSKIEGPFDVEAEVQPAKPLLASLKSYAELGDMERQG